MKTIVIVTTGKREDVDAASIHTFDSREKAEAFCTKTISPGKYWTNAQIVNEGKEIELGRPEDPEWW
jgi:hypothetical protein